MMSPKERREILRLNDINERDIFIFRWRIPQVLCEAPRTWGALTDVELITRARLLGYKNDELEQNFLVGKPRNVYKAFCECCGMRLRASPANREFKEKVRAKKKLIVHS